jgi:hypothetical protein
MPSWDRYPYQRAVPSMAAELALAFVSCLSLFGGAVERMTKRRQSGRWRGLGVAGGHENT